jgi:uncharacterized protein with PIN domain
VERIKEWFKQCTCKKHKYVLYSRFTIDGYNLYRCERCGKWKWQDDHFIGVMKKLLVRKL